MLRHRNVFFFNNLCRNSVIRNIIMKSGINREVKLERQDPGKYYKALFDLENRVAVIVGGTGVLCGEMARGVRRIIYVKD